jgi:hypothetical protein
MPSPPGDSIYAASVTYVIPQRIPGRSGPHLGCKIFDRIFPIRGHYETNSCFRSFGRFESRLVDAGSSSNLQRPRQRPPCPEGRPEATKSLRQDSRETAESRQQISQGATQGRQTRATPRINPATSQSGKTFPTRALPIQKLRTENQQLPTGFLKISRGRERVQPTLVDETRFGVPRSLRFFRKGRVLASRR